MKIARALNLLSALCAQPWISKPDDGVVRSVVLSDRAVNIVTDASRPYVAHPWADIEWSVESRGRVFVATPHLSDDTAVTHAGPAA